MNPCKFKLSILFPATTVFLFCIAASGYSQYTDNYAASFNGINSYVSVPAHSELNPGSAITVEAWINPSALPSSSACIIGKNYLTSYYFGIEYSGRIVFFPKGGTGNYLRSRVNGTVKANQWTHIAGTYDGTTTRIYINGNLDTSRTGITGVVGSNFDSLFIGCDRQSGSPAYFFNGQLDNVRIWQSARTAAELNAYKSVPLNIYQLSGSFSYLAASFQFDNSTEDLSGPAQNNGFKRNITFVSYVNKGLNHLDYNNSLVFNGTTDYCSHYNIGAWLNPNSRITLEAWVKRDTTGTSPTAQNIIDKSGGTTRYDYSLFIFNSGQVFFAINNGINLQTEPLVTNAQWTHLAATYNAATGSANIYVNGTLEATSIFPGHPLINVNSSDSMYIGGIGATSYAANKFKGQIDEVRIWGYARTANQIKQYMHRHPQSFQWEDSLMNFDFDNLHSGFPLDGTDYNYGLRLLGNTSISSAHTNSNYLSSPMLSSADGKFYDTAFVSSYRRFFVPDANAAGIEDSILVSGIGSVSNLKVYLLMSHTYTADLTITLTSPSGNSINLMSGKGSSSNDVMTIFSDDADSVSSYGYPVFNGPGITAPFSPSVKPDQPLSTFNGESRNGYWRLKVVDQAGADIGYVHGWGLNLPSYKTLNVHALLQGFYDSTSNKMTGDTAQIILRIPLPPYPILDSVKAVLDSNGFGKFNFSQINNGYKILKHRNSIETWTPTPIPFTGDSASYDFTSSSANAYGNNEILVDNTPALFAIYGGDINQDGLVDLTDVIGVFNDATGFTTGYVVTDVNGDDLVDLSDLSLTFNNSNAFVTKITP